ncbi:hypothetical protein Q0M94_21950 (plasmid) [Deinococcus radiomollis]|uniref:hypothetical protein n=1 Tax=Deinococcus radiomollis TaxID=468916 RepID=UPI003891D086
MHFVHSDGTEGFLDASESSQVPMVESSVQGVQIAWRFEIRDYRDVGGRNRWAYWNTPTGQLA